MNLDPQYARKGNLTLLLCALGSWRKIVQSHIFNPIQKFCSLIGGSAQSIRKLTAGLFCCRISPWALLSILPAALKVANRRTRPSLISSVNKNLRESPNSLLAHHPYYLSNNSSGVRVCWKKVGETLSSRSSTYPRHMLSCRRTFLTSTFSKEHSRRRNVKMRQIK